MNPHLLTSFKFVGGNHGSPINLQSRIQVPACAHPGCNVVLLDDGSLVDLSDIARVATSCMFSPASRRSVHSDGSNSGPVSIVEPAALPSPIPKSIAKDVLASRFSVGNPYQDFGYASFKIDDAVRTFDKADPEWLGDTGLQTDSVRQTSTDHCWQLLASARIHLVFTVRMLAALRARTLDTTLREVSEEQPLSWNEPLLSIGELIEGGDPDSSVSLASGIDAAMAWATTALGQFAMAWRDKAQARAAKNSEVMVAKTSNGFVNWFEYSREQWNSRRREAFTMYLRPEFDIATLAESSVDFKVGAAVAARGFDKKQKLRGLWKEVDEIDCEIRAKIALDHKDDMKAAKELKKERERAASNASIVAAVCSANRKPSPFTPTGIHKAPSRPEGNHGARSALGAKGTKTASSAKTPSDSPGFRSKVLAKPADKRRPFEVKALRLCATCKEPASSCKCPSTPDAQRPAATP